MECNHPCDANYLLKKIFLETTQKLGCSLKLKLKYYFTSKLKNQNLKISTHQYCLTRTFRMSWSDMIPSSNIASIYATIVFGLITVIVVFRLWMKATCGKFESDVITNFLSLNWNFFQTLVIDFLIEHYI